MHGLVRRILPSLFALGLTCSGQQWEIGGAVAGHHPFKRLSGEFRYTFRDSDIKITSGSTKAGFRGGGMKVFRGNEPERAAQPLSQLAAFRVDARDYITPFPKQVVEPNPRARLDRHQRRLLFRGQAT